MKIAAAMTSIKYCTAKQIMKKYRKGDSFTRVSAKPLDLTAYQETISSQLPRFSDLSRGLVMQPGLYGNERVISLTPNVIIRVGEEPREEPIPVQ